MIQKSNKSRILITGATGVAGGRILERLLRDGYHVAATSLKTIPNEIDIPYRLANLQNSRHAYELIKWAEPDIVIHTAARSNIDICEAYHDDSFRSNVLMVKNLVGLALFFKYKLIFFSSEQVYGEHPQRMRGKFRESDNLNPVNYYGRTKILAESEIVDHLKDYIILRLSLVYGWGTEKHLNWCNRLYEDLEESINRKMYKDQKRSMIFVDDIAETVAGILENSDMTGIYNLGSPKSIIRSNFAKEFARNWDFKDTLVKPVLMKDFPSGATRPKNCSLDITKLKERLNIKFHSVDEALRIMKENNPYNIKETLS